MYSHLVIIPGNSTLHWQVSNVNVNQLCKDSLKTQTSCYAMVITNIPLPN